ncbi:MAG: nickel pincer cofactor biosynthesis protein LarB [bacterium]|jgi:NCAIR mutase (PurE)-related protein|nr:nickel pincer cofactor biosynthesis protein LarB [bacterium]
MNPNKLRELLLHVQNGSLTIEEAVHSLKHLPYEDIGVAHIDHHRSLRQGLPEVIFCQNKDTGDIIEITKRMRVNGHPVLATRIMPDAFAALKDAFPEANFYHRSRIMTLGEDEVSPGVGNVLVICAGTSDLPVAEEATVTARFHGSNVTTLTDVGVAGIHRLFGKIDVIFSAQVIVVIAGMEGALASVVGGLVDVPVIAVPTSVGYGAHFGGVAALLSMLNSCSAGITVVNIDNGFGAGVAASQINKRISGVTHAKKGDEV